MLIPRLRSESSVEGNKDIVIEKDKKFGRKEFATSMNIKTNGRNNYLKFHLLVSVFPLASRRDDVSRRNRNK